MAGPDLEHIATQVRDIGRNLGRGPIPQSYHGDDGRHSDDDTQDGQGGPEDIPPDFTTGQK